MQDVIIVLNDNRDFVCAARDFYSAVQFLIENDWLTDEMECFDWYTGKTAPLKNYFVNYKDIIPNEWDMEMFNTFFCEHFTMRRVNIFTKVQGE